MRRAIVILAVLALGGTAAAQQSASFKLEEHAFNAGGDPSGGTVPASTGFRISLDAVGEAAAAGSPASASFRMDAGFGSSYPPPDEVAGLRFADAQTLEWAAEKSTGAYNLYRDLISNLAGLGFGSCLQQDLPGETATDVDPVPANDGFFYLVTAENRLAEEGSKGSRSDGTERLGAVCP